MKLGSRFLKATALSAMLVLTGCGDDNDNKVSVVAQSAVDTEQISTGNIISSLSDGIHRITIPAALSGQSEDQVHVIVKDFEPSTTYKGAGFIVNLGTFSDTTGTSSSEITVKTIEEGDFLSTLDDGIAQLSVDGKAFPDGQARTFTIMKDFEPATTYKGAGYATVLNSSLTHN